MDPQYTCSASSHIKIKAAARKAASGSQEKQTLPPRHASAGDIKCEELRTQVQLLLHVELVKSKAKLLGQGGIIAIPRRDGDGQKFRLGGKKQVGRADMLYPFQPK